MRLRELDKICNLKRGTAISKKSVLSGNIPVVAGGRGPAYFHNASNREGNIVTVSGSGAYAGYINYFTYPIFASDCFTIKPKDENEVYTKFIFFWLKAKQDFIYSLQSGAGQPHVYPRNLAKLTIDLPTLNEQKRIVTILDTADALRAKCCESLALLGTLLQSTFSDMFGDPVTNPMGWDKKSLGEIATLQRGFDLPVQKRCDGCVPIFAANGPVGTHNIYKVKGPGVVTGRSGTLGKVHYVSEDFWPLNTALWVKDFHGNNPIWVCFLLKFMRLEQYTRGVGVPTLNRNLVHVVDMPLPPLDLQQHFAAIVESVERQKTRQRAHLAELDTLFASLQQRAFNGELST